jgi:hypothetical protein
MVSLVLVLEIFPPNKYKKKLKFPFKQLSIFRQFAFRRPDIKGLSTGYKYFDKKKLFEVTSVGKSFQTEDPLV